MNNMMNGDVRKMLRICGLHQWQLAEAVGIGESTLCRWLRSPLSPDKLQRITAAIRELQAQGSDDPLQGVPAVEGGDAPC